MACPGEHDIVSPEDDPRYDPSRFDPFNEWEGPRPNILWSHCDNCEELFRWSVGDQTWRRWPGGLGLLPHLTDEKLDELHDAVQMRMSQLGEIVPIAQATGTRSEINYKLRILQSLSTAIQETRYQFWPPEGNYEPRAWGEAWQVLATWVQAQLNINGEARDDTPLSARAAFQAVHDRITDLWKGAQ